jgi:hypothetical protein
MHCKPDRLGDRMRLVQARLIQLGCWALVVGMLAAGAAFVWLWAETFVAAPDAGLYSVLAYVAAIALPASSMAFKAWRRRRLSA